MIDTAKAPQFEPTESLGRTMAIVVCVALVCSALVTTAVQVLRPIQAAYAGIERNRAIVFASGLVSNTANDADVVAAYLTLDVRVMDRENGQWLEQMDGRSFDHWQTDTAQPSPWVPVYLLHSNGHLDAVVVPVDGKGMWSTLYGYLALGADLNTVSRLVIHEHGETPGIGDRIQDPGWLARWQGKRLRDANGELKIEVSPDTALPDAHRVDTITGATITSRAVGRLVQESAQNYEVIFNRLRDEFNDTGVAAQVPL